MRYRRALLGSAGTLLLATSPQAAPLTCDQFRVRLGGAILASGKGVAMPAFTVGFESPARGRRYNWRVADTDGTMTCGTAGQFEEFLVTAHFTTKEAFASQMTQFITLSGAAACALTASGALLCADAGRVMLQDGLEQMGRGYNKGARNPSGLSRRTLAPGADAELSVAATVTSFLIGPGRGATIDETRQPIAGDAAKPAPP